MESVNKTLQKFLKDRNLDRVLDVQIDQLLEHPIFRKWWQEHPEWSQVQLKQFAIKVKQFVTEQENCTGCKGLHECRNIMKGHRAELINYGQLLDVSYSTCSYQRKAVHETRRSKLIQSHRIPGDIMSGSFRQFEQTEDRADAFAAVLDFCKHAQPGKNGEGIYLYGPLGAGKSFLLGAACNKLAERDIASYMVYTPEFLREMKGAIADQNVGQKIEAFQKVPVLIFDDIGAEMISAWIRDEVIGPILQYRVTEKLPTLYTSNYNFDQLEAHLSYTQRGGIERIEELKAKRLMERIRHYTKAYHVGGKNRRVQT